MTSQYFWGSIIGRVLITAERNGHNRRRCRFPVLVRVSQLTRATRFAVR